jgi:hypothetical protein
MKGNCVICGLSNAFTNGGWLCLPAYGETFPSVCRTCTALLVMSWAKEMKRQRDFPPTSPTTPTSPPSGDTEAPLLAVAA